MRPQARVFLVEKLKHLDVRKRRDRRLGIDDEAERPDLKSNSFRPAKHGERSPGDGAGANHERNPRMASEASEDQAESGDDKQPDHAQRLATREPDPRDTPPSARLAALLPRETGGGVTLGHPLRKR